MAEGPGEPGGNLGRVALFVAALVAVPLLAGALVWAVGSALAGPTVAAATAPSTLPEEPEPTLPVPGGLVVSPTPGLPGSADPGAPDGPVGPGLPPGWPEALTPPPGAVILSSVANGDTSILTYGSDEEAEYLADVLRVQLVAGGFEVTNELRAGDGSTATFQADSADRTATASVAPSPNAGQPPRAVTIVLQPR